MNDGTDLWTQVYLNWVFGVKLFGLSGASPLFHSVVLLDLSIYPHLLFHLPLENLSHTALHPSFFHKSQVWEMNPWTIYVV